MLIHTFADSFYIILQSFLFGQRHQNRFGLSRQYKVPIAGISRIGKNHFTLRIAKQHQGEKNRGGRAGSHDDTVRINRHSIFSLIKSCNFPT